MSARKKRSFDLNWLLISFTVILVALVVRNIPVNNTKCANTGSCAESLNLNVDNSETGFFEGNSVEPPDIDLSAPENQINVLGSETASVDKRIEVDLTTQTLKAFEGQDLYMEAKISSGKWFPTPTGEFTIWKKIRSTKMSGGSGADYYYLPNVPYVMFFSNSQIAAGRGFSLHGAYWHDNFGHAMSHGCVNMRQVDAKKLYDWANPITKGNDTSSTKADPGTRIIITGKAL